MVAPSAGNDFGGSIMMSSKVAVGISLLGVLSGCPSTDRDEVTGSEVAVSVVSGALNNTESKSALGFNLPARERRTKAEWLWDQVNPVRPAFAATWTCTGATLDPAYKGPGSYTYTPVSCSLTRRNGDTASSLWSSVFLLDYGPTCEPLSPFMENQAAGCTLTRTTTADGNMRTLTGPKGNSYAISHNTFGAGTGWDDAVFPAPANGGVILACGAAGCKASRALTISGSHLTGTINGVKLWDHTVSTGAGGISVTGSGENRIVNGSVTVQHNLAHVTSTTTFAAVAYGDNACCYPSSGSVTTTFASGPDKSKTESLAFSAVCGEVVLTKPDGSTRNLTLDQCL
jgi:hypothetical protein